jgi:hypothetical protein
LPNFSTDLVKNSKTAKGKKKEKFLKRKTNSFWSYVDGIHPGHLLARTWLKKITEKAVKHHQGTQTNFDEHYIPYQSARIFLAKLDRHRKNSVSVDIPR